MQKRILLLLTLIGIFTSFNCIAENNPLTPPKSLSASSKDESTNWILALLFTGKKVAIQSEMSQLYEDGLQGFVVVPKAANDIKVAIIDKNGIAIQIINLGYIKTPGLAQFKWDGRNSNGSQNMLGFYNLKAHAIIDGKTISLSTAGVSQVTSTSIIDDKLVLNLDGMGGIGLKDVIRIL